MRNSARESLKKFSEKFPKFWTHFIRTHAELENLGEGNRGHGLDHDLMVMGYCYLIAEGEMLPPAITEKAMIAAAIHSYDRFFGDKTPDKIDEALALLPSNSFSPEDIEEIKRAVYHHNEFNTPADNLIEIVLMDADRTANIGAVVITRSGQFYPTIPVVELGYTSGYKRVPGSTHKNPSSVRDSLISCLEWEYDPRVCIRLGTTRKLTRKYFDFLKQWFAIVDIQFKETGIDVWPL